MLVPKVKLNKANFDKMADVSIGVGNILFASFVVPFLVPNLDTPPLIVLLFGLGFSVGLWAFAIGIVQK